MIQNTMFNTQSVQSLQLQNLNNSTNETPAEMTRSFGSFLEDAINQVAAQEQNAHAMSDKFMLGEVSVEEVMITSQQALLGIQLTTQVRNKVIEAYQDIMRTQL